MSQASIVINVGTQEQIHSNGLSGTWIVPPKPPKDEFGILVVYPTPEIQDIGDGRRVMHWLKSRPLAMDICGMRSDSAAHGLGVSGNKEKWGLLLCEAEPDVTKELLTAIEEEIQYLNDNPPDVKMRKDAKSGAIVAVNLYEVPGSMEKHVELALTVQVLREEFVKECRGYVTKSEIARAKRNLLMEDQRLVAEGDRMWARPTEQQNINELHRKACERLGQERPWCYVPQQLTDCPGCGKKIQDNILVCPHCNGWLDEGIHVLTSMEPKQRAIKMYPSRFEREPVAIAGKEKGK
jgi:hypothetical protein